MIALTKTGETSTTITLGFSPVAGAVGYKFTAEQQSKPSHTWDPNTNSIRFAKGSAWYKVEALGVSDTGLYPAVTPPPPPPSDAHFVSDWRDGLIGYKAGQFDAGYPWATIFSYTSPGYQDVGLYGQAARASSADGRVAVVDNPYGSGKVLRCEVRDSDPGWPSSTSLQKAEIGSVEAPTCETFVLGMELWIDMELYLPNEYGLATGGSNAYNVLCDLHPQSNSGIPGVGIVTYGGSSTVKGQFGIGTTYRPVLFALDAAHRNRKIDITLGMKLAPNGWVEAWVDGQNVVPRLNCVTAETSEQGPYWKQGLYKQKDATSPGGKQVAYYGRTLISKTRSV